MNDSKALQPIERTCGAQLRGRVGTRCKQPAGQRTNHPGEGRCWLHGGLTPVRHGRYSKVVRREILELVNQMEQDPDPLNVLPELNMVRALLTDYINRYEENRDAMLAWYASWNGRPWRTEDLRLLEEVLNSYEGKMRESGEWEEDPPTAEKNDLVRAQILVANLTEAYSGRPREVLDLSHAYHMASEATKIVERVEKIRARGAISQQDFARVMTEMGRAVEGALSPMKVRSILTAHGVEPPEEAAMMAIADDLRNTLVDMWMTIRVQ